MRQFTPDSPNYLSYLGFVIPPLTVFLAMALTVVPLPAVGTVRIIILWPLLTVFFWALYRPDLQPLWTVFVLGLLYDLISGTPLLGVSSFLFVASALTTQIQHRALLLQNFWLGWAAAAVIVTLARLVEGLCYGIMIGSWPSLTTIGLSVLVSILAFPLLAGALTVLRRLLPVLK